MLNLDQVRKKIVETLPTHVRWHIKSEASGLDSPLDFDFSRSQHELQHVSNSDVTGFEIPQEWTYLYLFGQQDYAEGGGAAPYLGVHVGTGQVFALDVEDELEPIRLLNSDIDKFISTFDGFDRALRQVTLDVSQVAQLAESIDPAAFAESGWQDLIGAMVADGGDEDLTE